MRKKKLLTMLALLMTAATGAWAIPATPNSIVINGTPQVGDKSISLTYHFDPANVPDLDYGFAPTLKVKCAADNKWDETLLSSTEVSSGTTNISLSNLGEFEAGKTYEVCFAYKTGSWVDEVFQSFAPAAPAVPKHVITATYDEQTRLLEQPLPYETTVGALYEAVTGQPFSDLLRTMTALEIPLSGISSNNTSVVSIGEFNDASTTVTVKADGEATVSLSFSGYVKGIYVSVVPPLYVTMADGTKDAAKWTATVGTNSNAQALPVGKLSEKDPVTLTYGGRLKVKNVTATTDAEPDPLATPLTIEAITPGTIQVYIDGTLSTGMKYSKNGGTKTLITESTEITVAKNDKVQFYGNGTSTQAYGGNPQVSIQGTGDGFQTKVYGNIMSLLNETGFATKTDLPNVSRVFSGLFRGNATLIDASELLLPATQLTYGCYQQMFEGCTSLTKAPKLPATTLAILCYYNMFYRCTSLTNAYVKAAYTEERYPCRNMFDGYTATGAVLHTTPDNKASWEDVMGSGKEWSNWSVADDWQD